MCPNFSSSTLKDRKNGCENDGRKRGWLWHFWVVFVRFLTFDFFAVTRPTPWRPHKFILQPFKICIPARWPHRRPAAQLPLLVLWLTLQLSRRPMPPTLARLKWWLTSGHALTWIARTRTRRQARALRALVVRDLHQSRHLYELIHATRLWR